MGYTFTREGLKVDPKKASAILEAATPQNAIQVMSFLGIATYCSRFIPNLVMPLRVLTRKKAA